ncbi:MAG: hypothetical protein H7836_04320 [Magnetococcus sp. YQC-3]
MDIVQVLVSIFVGLGVLAGIVKWGISSYMEKSKELEKMKEKENNRVLKELEKSGKEIRHEVTHLTAKIADFESNLIKVSSHIKSFEQESRLVSAEQKKMLEDLKAQPKLFDRFELLEIKKDMYILKKKNTAVS